MFKMAAPIGGVVAFAQAAQQRQRRVQFVRYVGQPAPPCNFQALQIFGHAVDVAQQVANLVATRLAW